MPAASDTNDPFDDSLRAALDASTGLPAMLTGELTDVRRRARRHRARRRTVTALSAATAVVVGLVMVVPAVWDRSDSERLVALVEPSLERLTDRGLEVMMAAQTEPDSVDAVVDGVTVRASTTAAPVDPYAGLRTPGSGGALAVTGATVTVASVGSVLIVTAHLDDQEISSVELWLSEEDAPADVVAASRGFALLAAPVEGPPVPQRARLVAVDAGGDSIVETPFAATPQVPLTCETNTEIATTTPPSLPTPSSESNDIAPPLPAPC